MGWCCLLTWSRGLRATSQGPGAAAARNPLSSPPTSPLSLCSRGKKPVCWSGAGLGPGPGYPGKKRPDPSRCQSLAGQRGQAPVFSWAGAGRPAKTRGRAAAGHIPPPSPPHCRESYSASGNQEIVECCLLCVKLDIVTRVPPLGSLAMEV